MNGPLPPQTISQAMFGRRDRHPYYVYAMRHLETSAGIRVLHLLCHLLNLAGESAYVAIANPISPSEDFGPDLLTPPLTEAVAARHRAEGRTPIVIYPEVVEGEPLQGGVVVRYVMNLVGLLGGPAALPRADYVMAYAANLAADLPRCDRVLYLPVSDPDEFTPGPAQPRQGACAYAGKHVYVHGGRLDLGPEVQIITRDRPDSLDRNSLRALLRRVRALHVYENTALATEALLCGAAVIPHFNPFFDRIIAAGELGGGVGFAASDDPNEVDRAMGEAASFRAAYLAALDAASAALAGFIADTQALAVARPDAPAVRATSDRLLAAVDGTAAQVRRLVISLREIGPAKTVRRAGAGLRRRLSNRSAPLASPRGGPLS